MQMRLALHRKRNLGRLHLAGDLMPFAMADDIDQAADQIGPIRCRDERFEVRQILRRIEKGNLVPGRQVVKQMKWHRQVF